MTLMIIYAVLHCNSFSTTGNISGMEYTATAFVGCDNTYVRTFHCNNFLLYINLTPNVSQAKCDKQTKFYNTQVFICKFLL